MSQTPRAPEGMTEEQRQEWIDHQMAAFTEDLCAQVQRPTKGKPHRKPRVLGWRGQSVWEG